MKEAVLHGVDFSGSRYHARKIWISTWSGKGAAAVQGGFTHSELVRFIEQCDRDGAKHCFLIDTVFALPIELLRLHGVEPQWDKQAAWLASFPSPEAWREACRKKTHLEPKRLTDRLAHTPFAPANVRMYMQTWHGIVSVLRPLRKKRNVAILPFDAAARTRRWQKCTVWVGEGCPASFLRAAGWPARGYKGKSESAKQLRTKILELLECEEGIAVPESTARLVISQAGADALDSLLLLPGVRRFETVDHVEILRKAEEVATEGWIYF